ncbi:MAG: hypothetical protein OCD01_14635 [Fibrobacterales bacterium]
MGRFYTNPEYSPKPQQEIWIYPVQAKDFSMFAKLDFEKCFNLSQEEGDLMQLAADTVNKYLLKHAKSIYPNRKVSLPTKEQLEDVKFTTIRQPNTFNTIPFAMNIIKDGSSNITESALALYISDIKFGYAHEIKNYEYRRAKENGNEHRKSSTFHSFLPGQDFSLSFKFLLYDYSSKKYVSYGKVQRHESANFFINKSDWEDLLLNSTKRVLSSINF